MKKNISLYMNGGSTIEITENVDDILTALEKPAQFVVLTDTNKRKVCVSKIHIMFVKLPSEP